MKRRYRFMGRVKGQYGDQYVWQSTTRMPNDSRVEEIRCSVRWFWNDGPNALRPFLSRGVEETR